MPNRDRRVPRGFLSAFAFLAVLSSVSCADGQGQEPMLAERSRATARSGTFDATVVDATVVDTTVVDARASTSDADSSKRDGLAGKAAEILEGMSLQDKCAQLLMIGVEGRTEPARASATLLKDVPVGAVVYFSFNVPKEDPAGLADLSGALQDIAAVSGSRIPLFVAIDHEGGSVFRFARGLTRLPPARFVGGRDDAAALAETLGRIAAAELRSLGVTMNLAPVVEAADERSSRFLGSRSYSPDPRRCDEVAGAFIRGMDALDLACAIKHFPGNADADPHRALPVIPLSREEAETALFARFASAIREDPAAVMLSHVMLPSWDGTMPATLSPVLVDGVLRGKLGFRGIVLTDDVMMKGLTADRTPERAAVLAVAAGADMLMVTGLSHVRSIRDALVAAAVSGELSMARVDDAVTRILVQKLKYGLWTEFDVEARRARAARLKALVEEHSRLLAAFGL